MKRFLAICMMICLLAVSVFAVSDAYDTVEDAVAASGLKPLQDKIDQDSVYGSVGNGGEECNMLFDDDVTTKFCTGTFPLYAAWEMDKEYVINGMIVATANDNASYNGRNPETWILYGSDDDENWEAIAEGDESDFDETDYTYYTISFDNSKAYKYYMFEVPNAVSGCFQMSELVPCGAEASAAVEEAPAVVEEAPAPSEEIAEVAPAEEVPAVPATTAPATFDVMTVIVIAVAASLIAALAMKKRTVR